MFLLTHLDNRSKLVHQCHSSTVVGHQHRKLLEDSQQINTVCWAVVRLQADTQTFPLTSLVVNLFFWQTLIPGTQCQI